MTFNFQIEQGAKFVNRGDDVVEAFEVLSELGHRREDRRHDQLGGDDPGAYGLLLGAAGLALLVHRGLQGRDG